MGDEDDMMGFQGCDDMEDVERRIRRLNLLWWREHGHKFEYKGGGGG